MNSTKAYPIVPLSCALLGYIGTTLKRGIYSPSLKNEPPALKFAFGFAMDTSRPVSGAKSSSGCAISSGCSSGLSGLSTSVKNVSICLSGITTSASFTDVSSLKPLSPKEIKITITKNRANVIAEEKPIPAAYLFASKAFTYTLCIGFVTILIAERT